MRGIIVGVLIAVVFSIPAVIVLYLDWRNRKLEEWIVNCEIGRDGLYYFVENRETGERMPSDFDIERTAQELADHLNGKTRE